MSELPAGWCDVDLADDGPGIYRFERAGMIDLLTRFLAGCDAPEAAMDASLQRVLDAARGTPFAARHALARVSTLAEYQDAVPVRPFAELVAELTATADGAGTLVRHPIVGELRSSGTTAAPKRVPITAPWRDEVRDAAAIWRLAAVREHPDTAKGAILASLGFPGDAAEPRSMTGLLFATASAAVRERSAVPVDIDAILDAELRGYCALRLALDRDVRSWIVANPSVVVATCRFMARHADDLAADLADGTLERGPARALDPELRRRVRPLLRRRRPPADFRPASFWSLDVVHAWTSGPAAYFARAIPDAIGADVPVREVGLGATEGIFAIGLHGSWRGGVVVPGGPLIELVPALGGAAIPVHHGAIGRDYRLVISTTNGLYRYDIDDVVRFEGTWRRSPLLSFVRKGPDVISATGERVTVDQLVAAMIAVGAAGRFVAAARPGLRPSVVIAAEGPIPDAASLEHALCAVNVEYAARRATDRLGPLEVLAADPSAFDRSRDARIAAGAAPAQVKDRMVVPFDDLKWHVTARSSGTA